MTIADRIKQSIIDNGGYQKISDITGISKSTLVRTASGQTEPKLVDVMAIAKATNSTLNYIAYGMMTEDEEEAALEAKSMFSLVIKMVHDIDNRLGKLEQDLPSQGASEQAAIAEHLKELKYLKEIANINGDQALPEAPSSKAATKAANHLAEKATKHIDRQTSINQKSK